MTDEERRAMTRSNYAAQMEMLGYDASGNSLDMVRVVRCRDCKYGYLETNGYGEDMVMCTNAGNPIGFENLFMPSDWYCADGERREE